MGMASKRTAANVKQIRALHASGASVREIAEGIGVSHPTVSRWMRELKLTPNVSVGPRASRERTRSALPPEVQAAAEIVVSEGVDELDSVGGLDARLAEVRRLLAVIARAVESGEGSAPSYASLSKLEADLLAARAKLTPPAPPDPEVDPLNVEAADACRAKLERIVRRAEETARCQHCGKRPFAA